MNSTDKVPISRSVVTVAVGNIYYLNLAENLLKSFLLWNENNDIQFLLATDNAGFFSKYENSTKVTVRQIVIDASEKSFTSKFALFKHANGAENLFIDCDCLVYKALDSVFDAFAGKSFSAVGNNITDGDFFCDVKAIIKHFDLSALPKFVGSVYYFKKDAKAQQVFETAAAFKKDYDKLGFVRLRDKENEEPLFAVAMSLAGESLLPNNGKIKADLMYYSQVTSDVLSGFTSIGKPIIAITGGEIIPDKAAPAILHFNGAFSETHYYKSEQYRLSRKSANKVLTAIGAQLYFKIPYLIKTGLKSFLRPAYRTLFGKRRVNSSKRL